MRIKNLGDVKRVMSRVVSRVGVFYLLSVLYHINITLIKEVLILVHYEKNITVVLDALAKCQYDRRSLLLAEKCYAEFKDYMANKADSLFTP